jgi:Putative lumazine-binding
VTGRDEAAIRQAALDYVEGWFDGDALRMERALHPELVKRSVADTVKTLSAADMTDATARGVGQAQDPGDRQIELELHDAYDGIANATCRCALYVDYLQLARTDAG